MNRFIYALQTHLTSSAFELCLHSCSLNQTSHKCLQMCILIRDEVWPYETSARQLKEKQTGPENNPCNAARASLC